ncbi:hypothetical protein [Pseudoalteromonas luteoviolacea]|uniref:Uncharacterized protein n=1 Tax=Pseudoalteromonas luteoviolacea S4054 TaxID=1129367 RepID=A0A0F6A3J1_9GAMM|nr:hypothetical protein [Pseudoalteromonas luteoviolacea]AOT07704.1 hypothetical protein S4054249_07525 [Pseudoalteromonas luteoviolacea]AOT12620.1 hypothetical protein S40542_07525 [Pseudoalteromonas luteoviolacea]AOT17534.1 hypothetical protein S4054_07525 [Pseudoalteromonas luteoviolacea]KKE80785.1 hypothetical protein N479_24605 [Pseudoalteromonas luteoviolacea S4054]KZN62903.1 hypothetical protein N481_25740 [Pseudoalteromonas luteoviolacea S4047-1]
MYKLFLMVFLSISMSCQSGSSLEKIQSGPNDLLNLIYEGADSDIGLSSPHRFSVKKIENKDVSFHTLNNK